MFSVRIYFHPHLHPLLSNRACNEEVLYCFRDHPAIKDVIEANGIPHTEIDIILLNGCSVTFDHRLHDGDHVAIYPYGSPPITQPLIHLCPALVAEATFILDVHLGKLARRLRMLGFDCRYSNDCDDPELIRLALAEQRIILTRDRGILKHARVQNGLLIRSSDANDQVVEVLRRYRLAGDIKPLQRCPCCNGFLERVDKKSIRHHLLPKTSEYYDLFYRCCDCLKIFWKGSHYLRIARWIEEMCLA